MPDSTPKARILAAIAERPSPTRGEARRTATLVLTLSLAASLLIFYFIGGYRESDRPITLIIATVAGATILATIAAWGAIGRGGSMLGRRRRTLLLLIVLIPIALFAWKQLFSMGYSGMTRVWEDRPGFRCLRWSILIGIGPLLALLVLRRGSEPLQPGMTGAAIGVAAGAGAWVMIDLWCPVAHPLHLLVGHLLPLLVLALTGFVLGRRVLAMRG